MNMIFHNLRELAEHVEVLGNKQHKGDPVTADLLWSMAGRLRYRANQLEPHESLRRPIHEESEDLRPRRASNTIGSQIREKVREATERMEDDGLPLRRKRMTQDD